jgi:hypothetical protein
MKQLEEIPELPRAELHHRLKLGLQTLLGQCAERDERDIDAELAARFVSLFSLWDTGRVVPPGLVFEGDDLIRRCTVGKVAELCAALLEEIGK